MAMPLSESSMEILAKSDRWTAADLDHLPENGMRYEVLNGQLIVNAAPKPRHQRLIKWLDRTLDDVLPEGHFSVAGVGALIGEDEPIPDSIVGVGDIPMDGRGLPVT